METNEKTLNVKVNVELDDKLKDFGEKSPESFIKYMDVIKDISIENSKLEMSKLDHEEKMKEIDRNHDLKIKEMEHQHEEKMKEYEERMYRMKCDFVLGFISDTINDFSNWEEINKEINRKYNKIKGGAYAHE